MPRNTDSIRLVPTNIITGFLGVGKTTAILNLLKAKPANERWAVLVNEFGEIGVDGSIFEGQHQQGEGVFIAEVPGGCMCCAAGLPMQMALNDLLRRARPDRLLIEPTGLGHPFEVIQVLNEKHYQGVLDVQKTLTLVDARNLKDERYTRHETFNQQIAIADVVIGNKADLYQADDEQRLRAYVATHSAPQTELVFSEFGVLNPELLQGRSFSPLATGHAHHHHHGDNKPLASELKFPESGFIKAVNSGEGFVSVGWRFSPQKIFNLQQVRAFIESTPAERIKAVFITQQGIFSFNKTADGVQEMSLDEYSESRIEIIASSEDEAWQSVLLSCLN